MMDVEQDEDDNDFTQQNKSFRVPRENLPKSHILINLRWKNSELSQKLETNRMTLLFDEELDDIDFHPQNGIGVLFLTESDIVSQRNSAKRKMVRQRKKNEFKIVVLVEKTPITLQYYFEIQKFCVLQLGLVLLPVSNQTEAAGIVLYYATHKIDSFFIWKKDYQEEDEDEQKKAVLTLLQSVPGLGGISAKLLILNFGSVLEIANASMESLSQLVGKSTASRLKNFFNS